MGMIVKLIIDDGIEIEAQKGSTIEEALRNIPKNFSNNVIAAKIGDRAVDLSLPVENDMEISLIKADSKEGLEILRHSTSHVMAQAVKELYNNVKIAIGPATEDGFYYDFDYEGTFSSNDLDLIERRMQEIVEKDLPIRRKMISKEDAIILFSEMGETYKVELIRDIPDEEVSVYEQGNFVDLCRGPHVSSTGRLRAFKLLKVAGAYWRGDERNKMLQRIYGTAFDDEEALQNYLRWMEEAEKRNHVRLGRQLDLFSFNEEAGAGLVIYHPKGAMLRWILEDFEKREHRKRGYQIVMGPQILRLELWKKSGHLDYYREYMYFTEVDGESFAIKPMNCLSHMLIYGSKIRSYRELPIRYFELGTVHRHEKTGVRHGLLRARGFTQDDAHIFCTEKQLNSEIKGIISFIVDVMKLFGFPFDMEISTRPEKAFGNLDVWEKATSALEESLKESGFPYTINEGEGAFYGPKIDVKLRDALNRKWQCATIQCDFFLPERFDLFYVDFDGQRRRPIMLHRVILGSIERFIGILIEHYAGAFPLWLSPVQVVIITITDAHIEYAREVKERLINEDIRVEDDFRNEKLGYKVRDHQLQKIPYMLIIGNREVRERGVSVRSREKGDLGFMRLEEFVSKIKGEVGII
jgi:threonyl-tRNA synthetase